MLRLSPSNHDHFDIVFVDVLCVVCRVCIIWATTAGHDDITDLLCQRGAYVNVANEVGDTPLHLASWKDHPAVVEVLLRYQADKNMQNHDGRTPYSMARSDEVKQLLPGVVAYLCLFISASLSYFLASRGKRKKHVTLHRVNGETRHSEVALQPRGSWSKQGDTQTHQCIELQ